MKNKFKINGITFTSEIDDLNKEMVVYAMKFKDGACYIGKTKRSLLTRMNEHCTKELKSKNKKRIKHLMKYKDFDVTVLSTAKTERALFKKESLLIRNARKLKYNVLN